MQFNEIIFSTFSVQEAEYILSFIMLSRVEFNVKSQKPLGSNLEELLSHYIGSADASEQSKEFVPEISVRGYLIGGHRTSGCSRGVLQGQEEEGGLWVKFIKTALTY